MLHVSMGLIDKTGEVDANTLSAAAAAINVQVNRDLAQYWNVSASISALSAEGGVPPGLWPVFIVPAIKDAGGFHLTKHNQPYAEVAYGPGWTIAASHEVCEMLVDPSGNRLQPSLSIDLKSSRIVDGAGTFEYLVEVCDPSESPDNAYSIAGVTVSDFYTPHFYDPMAVAGTRYDFTGAIKAPRQVLKGGYFLSIQTSIEEQFEFLQARWINNPSRPRGPGGHDMIVGQNAAAEDGVRQCHLFGSGLQSGTVMAKKQFVVPTGGAYFFVPSLSAIRTVIASENAAPSDS
jgi:hypothetical protein